MNIYIDEAGRGPIAGPVWTGAVVLLDSKIDLSKYDDSKKLAEKDRVRLYSDIQKLHKNSQIYMSSGHCSAREIDRNGIVWSIRFAIIRSLYGLLKYTYPQKYVGCYIKKIRNRLAYQESIGDPVNLIIDGNSDFGLRKYLGMHVETIIKGDALVKAISMASIIAKVQRDKYMIDLDKISRKGTSYSDYGFAKHKGYGTKIHYDMIAKFGISREHRKTWIK